MNHKTFRFKIVAVLILFILQGCSNPLGGTKSAIDSGYGSEDNSKPNLPAATGFEQISGSHISKPSQSGNFKTDVTVGASAKDIRLTTAKNKIVYLSVQGQLISK
jgi:hypothetical protein